MKRLFSKSLCTSAAGANLKPPPADSAAIAKLILSSPNTTHQDDQFLLSTKTTPWTPNLVNSVLKRLWNHGPKALQFFHFLDNHHREYVHDASSFDLAIDIAARLHLHPTVWSLIHRMRSLRIGPSPKTFAIVAERAGQIRHAWEFFLEMKKRDCEIDVVTYTTVVHGFGVAGEIKRARNVFDEMIREGVLPSVATYNAMIQVLCKKDNVENAVVMFEEMVRRGYEPNVTTYNVLIRGLFHAGEFSRGEELMQRMENEGCEPNFQTYNMMIRYYSECSEVEKALGLFEKMGSGDCLPNLDTYNILISGMFVRKRSEDMVVAGKLLLEMVERGFIPRKFTFNRVLNGLLLTGNQAFAKEILRLQSKSGSRLLRKFRL